MSELTGEAAVLKFILEHTRNCFSFLDVGCGEGRYLGWIKQHYPLAYVVGLDVHRASVEKAPTDACIIGMMPICLGMFGDEAFDAVLAIDVLEHMPKSDAQAAIGHWKRIARRVCLLFVPEGEHPQEGTAENPHQAHRATWYANELCPAGFEVTRWRSFHEGSAGKAPGAFWAEYVRQ